MVSVYSLTQSSGFIPGFQIQGRKQWLKNPGYFNLDTLAGVAMINADHKFVLSILISSLGLTLLSKWSLWVNFLDTF